MVSANRDRAFHYRNDGFLTPEYWLSFTGRVALKVRTGGSNRAGILNRCFTAGIERSIPADINKNN